MSAICSEGPAIAVGENDFGDLARRERFGLDRADHLLTPAIADEGIGNADDVFLVIGPGVTRRHKNARYGRDREIARFD